MNRQKVSKKTSPQHLSTPISKDIAPSPSYGSLSGVVQRVQQEASTVSDDERQQLESAIGSRAYGEILVGKQTPWVPEFSGISGNLDVSIQTKAMDDVGVSEAQPENRTGLPDKLKAGIENLSGMAMDDVRVNYNSSKPAQLEALAYTQGTDIHIAPGQEKHLPHEAWHVVQQKQGRVKPTIEEKGLGVNNQWGLEKEADVMGTKALQISRVHNKQNCKQDASLSTATPKQMKKRSNLTQYQSDNMSLIQRKPLVNAPHMQSKGSWQESTDPKGRVDTVVAKNLQLNPGYSIPANDPNSPRALPKSWNWLDANNLTHTKGNPNYVRMHMLNGKMGGPGNVAGNLAPGTASLNTHHNKHFEHEATKWLAQGGEIDKYIVSVQYESPSRYLLTKPGKDAWLDTINEITGKMEFVYYDTSGNKKVGTADFLAEEDPQLDAKANWVGH